MPVCFASRKRFGVENTMNFSSLKRVNGVAEVRSVYQTGIMAKTAKTPVWSAASVTARAFFG